MFKNLFLLYIDAKSVEGGRKKGEKTQISEFTPDDFKMIQYIATRPNLFYNIIQSYCPTIYGQEIVKCALTLAIFGGIFSLYVKFYFRSS